MTQDRRAGLERAIHAAENTPAAEWPARLKMKPREEAFSHKQVAELQAACKTIADALRIQPCFLASRAALTAIVRHRPASIESVMGVSGMMRWQAELTIPAIKTVLGGI